MCIFGGGGPAKPTVSASDTINRSAPYAPVQRPDSPIAQLFRTRAMGTVGVMGNVTRRSHLTQKPGLVHPKTEATTLGGTTQLGTSSPREETLVDKVEDFAQGFWDRAAKLRRKLT